VAHLSVFVSFRALPGSGRPVNVSKQAASEPAASEQKVPLRHGQHFRGFAPQQHAIGLDLIRLWIDVDFWQVVIVDKIGFFYVATALYHADFLFQTQ
jgi:hypothetical protein